MYKRMHFWDLQTIVEGLKANAISNEEKMLHFRQWVFLLFFIALPNAENPYAFPKDSSPAYDLGFGIAGFGDLINLINCFLIARGISSSFRVNALGDNKNFLGRFVVLTTPLFLRIILVGFILNSAEIIYFDYITTHPAIERGTMLLINSIVNFIMILYFFRNMRKYLAIVSSGNQNG